MKWPGRRFREWLWPLPHHLRAMGYSSELAALDRRSRRCEAQSQSHLDNTRSLILRAAANRGRSEQALIVGSGLLLDIPLRGLAERFREVVLLDIAHCRRVRRVANGFRNVRLVQADVTGVVEKVYMLARTRCGDALPRHKPDLFLGEDFDLVVSANILSQLPVIPNGYAARRIKTLPSQAIDSFSHRLVENHLDWLATFPGVVCLIADLERLYYRDARLVDREASLWGVVLPEGAEEWVWDIAPRPEMDICHDIRHRVAGYVNFPEHEWLQRS